MRIHLLAILTVLAAGSVPAASAAPDFPGLHEKWSHYQSPHFELYSAISDSDSREMLEQLEVLRAVLMERLKFSEVLPLPVTIFCFNSREDFERSLPSRNEYPEQTHSYWVLQADRNVMFLAPNEADLQHNAVGQQFVDYLFAVSGQNPARWYRTGLCQLYGNVSVDRKTLELGVTASGWESNLKLHSLFPLEQFFAFGNRSPTLESPTRLSTYCAQAWVLMHYCEFGRRTLPKEKLRAFLAAVSDQSMQDDLPGLRRKCREILGCDYPELQEELHRYVTKADFPSISIPRPVLDSSASYARRKVAEAEMRLRLAELAYRVDRSPRGHLALLQATDLNPAEPRVFEVLGNDAALHDEAKEAREHWAKALAMGSGNPSVIRRYADLEVGRWFQSLDPDFRLPAERATEYRALLQHSLRLAPLQTGAYELLAWVESAAATADAANVRLVEDRRPLLRHRAHTQLALALICWHAHDLPGAREKLAELPQLHPDAQEQAAAAFLRAEMERRAAGPAPEPAPAGGG